MIANFLEWLSGGVFELLEAVIGILPAMPLSADALSSYLGDNIVITALQWVNYLMPIPAMLAIFGTWSAAIIGYSSVKLALKYGKDFI